MDSNKGSDGGHWSKDAHLRMNGAHTFNNGICGWIMNNLKPTSVLEFGCGLGFYSNYFSSKGAATVHAIEPEKMDSRMFSEERDCIQFEFDITKDDIPEKINNREYDLVFSMEVMEHIDRKYHDDIFDFLCEKSNKFIVFSAARMGQFGHGHIACRNQEDWRSEFPKRGFKFNPEMTEKIRKASNEINVNHKRNVQVFEKIKLD